METLRDLMEMHRDLIVKEPKTEGRTNRGQIQQVLMH